MGIYTRYSSFKNTPKSFNGVGVDIRSFDNIRFLVVHKGMLVAILCKLLARTQLICVDGVISRKVFFDLLEDGPSSRIWYMS
jgi:hypothetical protein